jgi:signal transduction histidine kinase
MTRSPSLRSRLLFGAALWSIGLVIMATAALVAVIESHPGVRRSIEHSVHGPFQQPFVLIVGVLCMVGGFLQVRRGVSPINSLRTRLAGLHSGRDRRVVGTYPAEVQPLVNDLNTLLEQREQAVQRAVAKAGDLAHGLKTPLAILANEAQRVSAAGSDDLAEAVAHQVERMRRQVNYHLAHARASASGTGSGSRSAVAESADGLARALLRLYAERGIAIDVEVCHPATVRVQREDLDEMLGNLLDNACKWGRSRVIIRAESTDAAVVITVEDDGPGLPAAMRETVLMRGVRADESGAGSGLGLAIVHDLADLYGGSITLDASPLGGLSARLRLPA